MSCNSTKAQSPKLALAFSWELICKQTDCITAAISKRADPNIQGCIDTHIDRKHFYDFIRSTDVV